MLQQIYADIIIIENLQYQQVFAKLQNDEYIKVLFNIENAMA
jgi:hypothetical protein